MSSYQIKSTPYFRRIINNSKNNGQLQNLREEFDRIQEFNDRTIEMKMRQVRLKRLFRQIEEIKEATTSRSEECLAALVANSRPFFVNPSPVDGTQAERFEAIARAREFGKEISRRNALSMQQGGGLHKFSLRSTSKMRAVAEASRADSERRERTFARINYGNAQSKCNIQRIIQRRLRNRQLRHNHADSETTDYHLQREPSQGLDLRYKEKRTKLQHRLAYGNAQSFSNKERAAAAAAAIALRRKAAATAAATETNEMVYSTGSDMNAIANYYNDDDAGAMNPTDDDDDYDDFQSAMLLTPTPSPHDLCLKKTMILKRNVGGSYFVQLQEDDRNTISAIRLRARGNWRQLFTMTLPWISLLQGCRKFVDISDHDESGTNLFLSATETSTHRQPIVKTKHTLTSDSFQDILSNNESTVINNAGNINGARTAIMEFKNRNSQDQGNDAAAAAGASAAAAPVSISEVIQEGEEVSETEEVNSDEKYPNPESEYFEDFEEGLEAESPTSGVEDPSSEADNVLSKIAYPELKNKNQVKKTNLPLIEHPVSNTEDHASKSANNPLPVDDVEKVDNEDELQLDTMNSEGFWQTSLQAFIVAKYDVPIQSGNVSRLRKVFEPEFLLMKRKREQSQQ